MAYQTFEPYIKDDFIALPGDAIAFANAYKDIYERFQQTGNPTLSFSPRMTECTHGVGKVREGEVTELSWYNAIARKGSMTPLAKKYVTETAHHDHYRDMTIFATDRKIFPQLASYPTQGREGIRIGEVFMHELAKGYPLQGNIYTDPWVHVSFPKDLRKSMYSSALEIAS